MSGKQFEDWSSRHVRLRFEMMASALLLAAFAFVDQPLKTSSILPIDLEKVGPTTLFWIVTCFYAVTFVHFLVRTQTETAAIRDDIGRVETLLQNIDHAKRGVIDRITRLNSDDLRNSIDRCDDALAKLVLNGPFPSDEVSRMIKKLEAMMPVLSKTRSAEEVAWLAELQELAKIAKSFEYLPEIADAIKQASRPLREDFVAFRHLLKDEIPNTAQQANDRIHIDFAALKALESRFNRGRNMISFERLILSCWFPAGLSFAIVSVAVTEQVGVASIC
ncbi:hypothetical protein GOC13_22755 [Sinorhizobium meliloti]|nr:hypothetical protein [Sinorhizobium meliloti]MDW9984827.1 hypothetical protein [Sinorhizobium meliloti]MDX0270576.1 hypothetical protein [Sinorhizobium meliloti]